ncbi:MAG TPA: HIT domain-containing protein [Oceanospirillales bacterium]|nr:HIT domain-containing protein [Oceanospirillales bacterium]
MSASFSLHPQLTKDTHNLFIHKNIHITLHKNATIPWIILVPITARTEIYHLSAETTRILTQLYTDIGLYFSQRFNTEKMNIAAIGNIVQQLHIHVIGRKPDDACWPGVVWGSNYPIKAYTSGQLQSIKNDLKGLITQINTP